LIDLPPAWEPTGVGLNPLHALFGRPPGRLQPYSPNSRLFLNPLYVDVEKLPGFQRAGETNDALARLRAGDIVDYAGVAELKWRALLFAFQTFKANPKAERRKDFENFRAERAPCCRGSPVSRCCGTNSARLGGNGRKNGASRMRPDARPCVRGRMPRQSNSSNSCSGRPIGSCRPARSLAGRLGMKVGLYLDVAVGVQCDGFDAWNEQSAISRHLSVGAPPDPLNTAGQNWGLAGFNAAGLELQSFEPYREMLRASMRHAGAIRLDHVLGLKRLYWCRTALPPTTASMCRCRSRRCWPPRQESVKHRCVVIGEDLGTVPEGFREQMAELGHLVV
jgi:4-alpha-glucanotransferase